MKFEIDNRELKLWWILLYHLKFHRFLRLLRKTYFNLVEFIDKSPIDKPNESARDWLKRVPSKYAERFAEYLYNQRRSYYIEVRKRMVIYDYKNMNKKNKKVYKELLDETRTQFVQAEEMYKEVLIRSNLASKALTK